MKKRRLLSIVLSLCMVLAFMPQMVFAEDDPGTLKITIEGFEVGNTPGDIKLSFESTIPGITFNEEDIKSVSWLKDLGGGEDIPPDVFEANCNYRCGIVLEPKGLTDAPEVTVNGKEPSYCEIATNNGVPYALNIGGFLGTPAPVYTITYAPGEGEGSIAPDTKTHGKAFTLSSDTFTRDGYVQTGWVDKESGKKYSLGGIYDEDTNVTLYPVWDEIVTLEIPFTTTVKQEGNVAPEETTFDLAVVDANAGEKSYKDITVTGSVTTNGAGDYESTMTITGPSQQLRDMLSNGVFVSQVNAGEQYWKYDDTVWYLCPSVAAMSSTDDAVSGNFISIYPTGYEESGDGSRYYYQDPDANPVSRMLFINRYTESTAVPSDSEGTTTGESDKADKNVKTGDDANLALWLALMLLSGAGITGVTAYTRRKRTNE